MSFFSNSLPGLKPRSDAKRHAGITRALAAAREHTKDHLLRSAVFVIMGTVTSSLMGFVYWYLAARNAPAESVGFTSAAISTTTAASLVATLGVNHYLLERLPRLEGTRSWAEMLSAWLWPAAALSAVVAGAFGVVTGFRSGDLPTLALVTVFGLGAASITIMGVLDKVFLSARRARIGLLLALLAGTAKVTSLALLWHSSQTATASMTAGWVIALLGSSLIGVFLLIPRLGFGRVRFRSSFRPKVEDLVKVVGHHLTSVGGLMAPYLLPPMVVIRLGAEQNAYFYTTWMLGSMFLIISPAVSSSLLGEGARDRSALHERVGRAVRILITLLPLPIALAAVAGNWVLSLFGPEYAAAGYLLLVVLAMSAIPDACTNIAVAILRVRGQLRTSATLNIFMGVVALVGAWVLLPRLGIVGAGVAWFVAQSLGCLAIAPVVCRMRQPSPEANAASGELLTSTTE